MIEIKNVSKKFDNIQALSHINAKMEEGHVFGLIGTNGAGKSTLMRSICGVYRPEEGEVLIDGQPVYDNPSVKEKVFYISDDQCFIGSTAMDMVQFYETMYRNFNRERFLSLMDALQLDPQRRVNTFSKGMKKQLSVLLGVSSGTKYLLCDETFDGLDPVIRQAIKRLFANELEKNNLTPIITSHNLRELEDICEQVGLLHKGGILFTKDLEEMKLGMVKAQVAFQNPEDAQKVLAKFPVVRMSNSGSLYTLTVRGHMDEVCDYINTLNPKFTETIPLSLEEIFISETEVLGYDFSNIVC